MKNILITILILFFAFLFSDCSKNEVGSTKPKYETVINLDKDYETQKIPVRVIYNNDSIRSDTALKNSSVRVILSVAEGPDSTIYVIDNEKSRLVQFSSNGKYIKSIGKRGKGPGEFLEPQGIANVSNKYIYVSDPPARRLHILDFQGNYIRSMTNLNLDGGGAFSVGRNNVIFTRPPENNQQNLLVEYDSSGKEIKKMGVTNLNDKLVFKNNFRDPYYIVAGENSDYIWCIFKLSNTIRKYDYDGNFIEEIRFEGNLLKKSLDENKANEKNFVENKDSISVIRVGVVIFYGYELLKTGDLTINIANYGNLLLSGKETNSKVIKKYEISGLPENSREKPFEFNLVYINDIIYGYSNMGKIIKETR